VSLPASDAGRKEDDMAKQSENLTTEQTNAINTLAIAAHQYAIYGTDDTWKALLAARAALVALGLPI
jgi:hypothetical protein